MRIKHTVIRLSKHAIHEHGGRPVMTLAIFMLFALSGAIIIGLSKASILSPSVEPEDGSLTAPAESVQDSTASNDSAITFGSRQSGIRNLQAKGIGFSYPWSYPSQNSDQQQAAFAGMKAAGATWTRVDIPWSIVQSSNKDAYNWSRIDTVINNAQDAGLKIDGIVAFAPTWARKAACKTNNSCPPQDPDQFAEFAKQVVQRYGSQLGAIEIWNEPNIYQFWYPNPVASEYVALLKPAYTAIKSIDPHVLVMTAGISVSYNDSTNHHYIDHRTYLKQLYDLGAKDYFDAVAYHPYSGSQPPSNYRVYSGWSQISQTPSSMRSVMDSYGDSAKRLWLTEYGAPTGGPSKNITATCQNYDYTGRPNVDECLQAKMLSEAVAVDLQTPLLGPLFVYSYIDRSLPGGETQENHFGIVNKDSTPKQSYNAVKQAIGAN